MAIICRRAQADDLSMLSGIWHEKLTILAGADKRYMPTSDAGARWLEAAMLWLSDETCAMFVACADDRPIGYALGAVQSAPPGLSYPLMGAITQMAIDPHGYYGGAARMLVEAIRNWFGERDVKRVVVYVPHRSPAEQAFWRAYGTSEWMDILWLKS